LTAAAENVRNELQMPLFSGEKMLKEGENRDKQTNWRFHFNNTKTLKFPFKTA